MKDKATSPEPKRAYCTEPDGCPWTSCDCPLKTSSPEHQEKPFLTEDDGEQEVMKAGYYEQYHKSPGEYFFKGFMCAASKANARISELESQLSSLRAENEYLQTQLDIQKRITDGRDRSICDLESALHKLESELKALREERDQLKDWKESEMAIWDPVLEFCQDEHEKLGIPLGASISKWILKQLKAYTLNTEKKS